MSVPRANYDPRRVCLISLPNIMGAAMGEHTLAVCMLILWLLLIQARRNERLAYIPQEHLYANGMMPHHQCD